MMDKDITFSVIVPAYNSESYIDKCIESVLKQTCADLELVLVDDGSADGTLQKLMSYAEKDKRVKVLHQENGGHTSARNLGLSSSVGRYVIFLDSDDWLDTTVLEEAYGEIERNSPDVIVFGICAETKDGPRFFENCIADGFYRLSDKSNSIIDSILMTPSGKFAFPKSLSGKVFKREKVLEHQMSVPKSVWVGEDGACFVITVLGSETVSVIKNVNYLCTIREGSMSRSADRLALRRCLDLFDYYAARIENKDNGIKEQFWRYTVHHIFTSIQFVAASGLSKKELRAELDGIMKNDAVRYAVRHARFDKKAYKMRFKQTVIKFKLLGVIRALVKKRSIS